MDEKLPTELRITRFLARYRITPQTATGRTPAELLMSRLPKTHLDLLQGNLASRVHRKQDNQKKYDNASQLRVFENGDLVLTHSAPVGSRKITWIPGVVQRVTGPLSYELEIEGQSIVKRHVDQIRKRYCEVPSSVSVGSDFLMDFPLSTQFQPFHVTTPPEPVAISDGQASVNAPAVPPGTSTAGTSTAGTLTPGTPKAPSRPTVAKETVPVETTEPVVRRSLRVSKKPERFIERY